MTSQTIRKPLTRMVASLVVLGLACEADPLTDPVPDDAGLAGEELAFEPVPVSNFEQMLGQRVVRVQIELRADELTATEVEIESDDELADEEEIRSRASAVATTALGGVLTLDLGGLEVTFDGDTRFRVAGGDDISMDDFIAEIEGALDAGIHPAVKAERDPPAVPQAPGDGTFHAGELRLDSDLRQPELELNLSLDHLIRNNAPPPDAWIAALGLRIALRVSEGITEIEVERPEIEVVEFEGVVVSVNLDHGSFALQDGVVVKMIGRTDVMETDGGRRRLHQLTAVAEAVREGLTVLAYGKGAVESRDPLVLVALRVGFEVDPATLEEFGGLVTSVNLDNRSFDLEGGATVRVIGLTMFGHMDDWSMADDVLARVAQAVENGVPVVSQGFGVAVTDEDPPTLVAIRVHFGIEPPPFEDFEGVVDSVDLDGNRFTLEDGTVIQLPVRAEGAEVGSPGGDGGAVSHDLRDVVEAMRNGLSVLAWGAGQVTGQNPLTILAGRLRFALQTAGSADFSGEVTGVDVAARTFTLVGGSVMRLIGLTAVRFEFHRISASADAAASAGGMDQVPGDPLALAKRALDAGLTVTAAGAAVADPSDAARGLVLAVVFAVDLPLVEKFEGQVVAVHPDRGAFELRDGTLVIWPFVDAVSLSGVQDPSHPNRLHALQEALDAGLTVFARGEGVAQGTNPRILVAWWVELEVDRTDAAGFEGTVVSVDDGAHSVTLEDGSVVKLLMITEIVIGDERHSLAVLSRIGSALNEHSVQIRGVGLPVPGTSGAFVAIVAKFAIE